MEKSGKVCAKALLMQVGISPLEPIFTYLKGLRHLEMEAAVETQSFINFLTALFLPAAIVAIRGQDMRVHVPSGMVVAHRWGCRSAAIILKSDFILSLGGTRQA